MSRKKGVCIGIISDTHMPSRWKSMPAGVTEVFRDVDLIIHAGDVGELWVLDELSQIAPVIAVHGNDETEAAKRALPFIQTLSIAGRRIVLTHGHNPDLAEEMRGRADDRWQPKLQRRVEAARQHGATIAIYGHTHIPMALDYDGVFLINGGAIASGGLVTRQKVQTVARLTLQNGQPPVVQHFEVNRPTQPYPIQIDLEAGFKRALDQFGEPILDPVLEQEFNWLRINIVPLAPDEITAAIFPLAWRCWEGQQDTITIEDMVQAMRNDPVLYQKVSARLSESPAFARYMTG